jgi:hypothetical protein
VAESLRSNQVTTGDNMSFKSKFKSIARRLLKKSIKVLKKQLLVFIRTEFYSALDKLAEDHRYVNVTPDFIEEVKDAFENELSRF